MIKSTIIDLLATRLPDDAESYPDWTIRCAWGCEEDGEEVAFTFHRGTSERTAVSLAMFVLDRYLDLDVHKLSRVDVRHPDGEWENIPRPSTRVTAPVLFAFQRLPQRPTSGPTRAVRKRRGQPLCGRSAPRMYRGEPRPHVPLFPA